MGTIGAMKPIVFPLSLNSSRIRPKKWAEFSLDPIAKLRSTQMKKTFQSSRDVIIQTDNWAKAIEFYETTMGFTVSHRSSILMGFETGAFCLYVEKGNRPGPVFDFLVPDMQAAKRRLLTAGCTVVEENPAIPRCYIRDPFGLVFNVEEKSDSA